MMNNIYVLKRRSVGWLVAFLRMVLVLGLCFLILQPLLSKVSMSFMPFGELNDATVINVPRQPTLEHYTLTAYLMQYQRTLLNSIWVSLLVAVIQVFAATVVAYGFARFTFPFKRLIFGLVLFMIVVPPQTIMTSLYMYFRFFDIFGIITLITGQPMNLLNTVAPYLLMLAGCMGLKSGLYIYLLRQFFRGMPKELEEAAYVDGSGAFRTFFSIMLPDALPMVTSCFLFAFVWQWTDDFYAKLFFRGVPMLAGAVSNLGERYVGYLANTLNVLGSAPPEHISILTSAGTLMTIGPILLVYLVAQRGFVESVSKSGIKG
jgi:multiple sugar transport system permease protein